MSQEDQGYVDSAELRKTFLSKTDKSDGAHKDGDTTDDFSALDLTKETKLAIHDVQKRTALQEKTNKRTDMRCKVCSSKYFSIYQEWLSMHKYTGAKASKLALRYFSEAVSSKSFTNHKKNHMGNPFLIRRLMIASDPKVNPLKVVDATIQILHQQLLETEYADPKLLAQLKDFLQLHGDYTGETKKVPEKAVQINTYNISNTPSLPMAKDSQLLIESVLSESEEAQLRALGIMLNDTGTSGIRKQIPTDIPKVSKKAENVIDAIIVEED